MVVTPYIKNHDATSLKPVNLFVAAKEWIAFCFKTEYNVVVGLILLKCWELIVGIFYCNSKDHIKTSRIPP